MSLLALRPHRTAVLVSFDAVLWVLATAAAELLRVQSVADVSLDETVLVGVCIAVGYVTCGLPLRLHEGRARTASFEEMSLMGAVAAMAGATVFVANLLTITVPRSVPIIATVVFIVAASWGRATWRRLAEREMARGSDAESAEPVVLVGAGHAAGELISSMLRDPAARWCPVAMLDDDPRKRHLRVRGVPVRGSTQDLADVVAATGVRTAILAMPSAGRELVREISQAAHDLGVDLKVLPTPTQLLSEHVGVRDIRDLNLTDLLGRNQLDTDMESIAGYLTGRRVLVTGAGGSIGSELCRQIDRFGPAELMMLDRDESALHAVQLSLSGRALLDSDDVVLCDIRDLAALERIFVDRRPHVVFHAAALKHLPMLEQYPTEAVKTNVIGTRNVLDAALAAGVERFVNISTDKAANPASMLGCSKRVAERLTSTYAALAPQMTSTSVRFGNVLGSRGSVLTTFAGQIARGGPITVTHPEVTRYFMTVEEACQLVVQAGAIGAGGEVLVLDMGEPVSILGVAHQLVELHGRPVPIEYTGLREGEKLHEELFSDDEPQHVRPEHPLISHVPVSGVSELEIERLARRDTPVATAHALRELCDSEAATVRVTAG